eukprot:5891707-Amphidinium_carterae.1
MVWAFAKIEGKTKTTLGTSSSCLNLSIQILIHGVPDVGSKRRQREGGQDIKQNQTHGHIKKYVVILVRLDHHFSLWSGELLGWAEPVRADVVVSAGTQGGGKSRLAWPRLPQFLRPNSCLVSASVEPASKALAQLITIQVSHCVMC